MYGMHFNVDGDKCIASLVADELFKKNPSGGFVRRSHKLEEFDVATVYE